jgi:hypothetical protein
MQFFECFLLNAMQNEENKGNNAIFLNVSCWMRWKMKKIKEIKQFFECFLLNAMKNEENNAIFWMFLVKCDEKWRK